MCIFKMGSSQLYFLSELWQLEVNMFSSFYSKIQNRVSISEEKRIEKKGVTGR